MANLQNIIRLFYNKSGHLNREQVILACSILDKSGVIALPTDTLYGIAAKVNDTTAIEKMYKIKGRDPAKPLAVCIPNVDAIEEVADIGQTSINVFKSLLPGPITIVLKLSTNLNKALNPSVDTIGVRVPDHNFVMALCCSVGPLALTSANKSGEKSPLEVGDFKDIWSDLDCIFDAGEIRKGMLETSALMTTMRAGSTVVDLTDPSNKFYKIIREGCALNRVINTLNKLGYRRRQ